MEVDFINDGPVTLMIDSKNILRIKEMELTTLTNGIFGSNTYIVESDKQCAIIDCGNKPQDIKRVIDSKGLHRNILFLRMVMRIIFFARKGKGCYRCPLYAFIKMICPIFDSDKNGYNLFGFNSDFPNPYPDCLLKAWR